MNNFGEVLETLRRAQGFTQDDLLEKINVTQAALSRYENNLRMPDTEVIERLARTLGVTPAFLTRDHRVRGALAVDAHMRRQRTTKASLWRRLEARLNKYRLHISTLFEEVSMRAEQTVPTFDPVDTSPVQAALMVRAQWRMPVGPVRNLTRWLEAAGCVVLEENFGTSRIDGMSQWIDDHPIMLINNAVPTDRKRLTLAHELGHLVLHNGLATDDPEREANEFAAELLMPGHVIKPDLCPATIGRLRDLKRVWGVSMQALYERAYSLDMVTSTERATFYRSMNARGWKTMEPDSDLLAPETPQLVTSIGSTLRSKGLSDREIASRAGFTEDSPDNPFLAPTRHLRAV
ncbi:Zn-dependent peptidase ImmA, M78 family [Amycolatopsis arida]|uniref:Zn-dependent peptidase ImmA, M78 family n=1 Tax=Amycolatopsis arida TaxID=587909 RepID=A0A1I6A5W8_9PSEU|nr:XRE family transcriptional regulator [Amycolatopsis arida]TDX88587.1 Zn-dependent peptidase ImmA (M78 family) [Amycolatopsis arida]SFQ64144.1 Zn-dependent peptidase ImmA, M78 family [Amycolatopsis arida]